MFVVLTAFGLMGFYGGEWGQRQMVKLCAKDIANTHKMMKKSFSELPEGALITVSYDAISSEPKKELERVCSLLQMEPDRSLLQLASSSPRPLKLAKAVQEVAPFLVESMLRDGTWRNEWDTPAL
jgi:hypothetical protein